MVLGILAGTKNKTAAEVAAVVVSEAPRISGQKLLHAALAANTAGRAKVIVREDATKNVAWAQARLRERFGRDSRATSFTEVFQYSWLSEKPFEDVWREWVKKVGPCQGRRLVFPGPMDVVGFAHVIRHLECPGEVRAAQRRALLLLHQEGAHCSYEAS